MTSLGFLNMYQPRNCAPFCLVCCSSLSWSNSKLLSLLSNFNQTTLLHFINKSTFITSMCDVKFNNGKLIVYPQTSRSSIFSRCKIKNNFIISYMRDSPNKVNFHFPISSGKLSPLPAPLPYFLSITLPLNTIFIPKHRFLHNAL